MQLIETNNIIMQKEIILEAKEKIKLYKLFI